MAVPRLTGSVIRIVSDKGFGFIRGSDNQEYFFHRSSVRNNTFDDLNDHAQVTFTPTQGPKGSRAEDVEPAE